MNGLRKALVCLALLLPVACTTEEDGGIPLDRHCGTSCGGGNPPAFRFDQPFTGTVSLFVATQNPVMDSTPFFSQEVSGVDSLRLERSMLDAILETDKLDSVLKHTLPDSARKARPASLLEFNMVFRSGDSAWLIPGIGYQKGGLDTDQVFEIRSMEPILEFEGKVVLPPPDLGDDQRSSRDYLYFAGTPYRSDIDFEKRFRLKGYQAGRAVVPKVFRWYSPPGNNPNKGAAVSIFESQAPLSSDSGQVLNFNQVADSLPTSWAPPF